MVALPRSEFVLDLNYGKQVVTSPGFGFAEVKVMIGIPHTAEKRM